MQAGTSTQNLVWKGLHQVLDGILAMAPQLCHDVWWVTLVQHCNGLRIKALLKSNMQCPEDTGNFSNSRRQCIHLLDWQVLPADAHSSHVAMGSAGGTGLL